MKFKLWNIKFSTKTIVKTQNYENTKLKKIQNTESLEWRQYKIVKIPNWKKYQIVRIKKKLNSSSKNYKITKKGYNTNYK